MEECPSLVWHRKGTQSFDDFFERELEDLTRLTPYRHDAAGGVIYCTEDPADAPYVVRDVEQRDLAKIIGATRETVSHGLARLLEYGVVRKRRTLVIVNIVALQRLLEEDA